MANLPDIQHEGNLTITAQMYLQGHRQTDIAEALGVSQPQVSKYLKKIRKRWLDSQIKDFNEAKAAQIEKINYVESKAWESYEKSKTKHIKDGNGNLHVVESEGDARFLQVALNCIDKRIKLLGLDRELINEGKSNANVVVLPDNKRTAMDEKNESQLDELINAATLDGYEDAEIID